MEEENTELEKTKEWLKMALAHKDKESLELIDRIAENMVKLQGKVFPEELTQSGWYWVIFIFFILGWGGDFFKNLDNNTITK